MKVVCDKEKDRFEKGCQRQSDTQCIGIGDNRFLSRPDTDELASLTLFNSVEFHTGTDERASSTLFNSVKFSGHL